MNKEQIEFLIGVVEDVQGLIPDTPVAVRIRQRLAKAREILTAALSRSGGGGSKQ